VTRDSKPPYACRKGNYLGGKADAIEPRFLLGTDRALLNVQACPGNRIAKRARTDVFRRRADGIVG
jgi:hypothetical protein